MVSCGLMVVRMASLWFRKLYPSVSYDFLCVSYGVQWFPSGFLMVCQTRCPCKIFWTIPMRSLRLFMSSPCNNNSQRLINLNSSSLGIFQGHRCLSQCCSGEGHHQPFVVTYDVIWLYIYIIYIYIQIHMYTHILIYKCVAPWIGACLTRISGTAPYILILAAFL